MQATLRANRNRNTAPRAMPLKLARFWLVCLFFLLWACAIAARLFWLQIVRHANMLSAPQKQQQRTFEVAPRRGVLYDRNLRELAMTVQVDSIYAVPTEIDDKQGRRAHPCRLSSTPIPKTRKPPRRKLPTASTTDTALPGLRAASRPKSPRACRALNMKGIYFQKEFQRFYPDNQIAAQVLGYVGVDDNGLGGLEQKFDAQLHGVPGRVFTAMDARRQVLGSSEHEPEPGQNLVLTIDDNIQFMAEQALDHAMEKTQARQRHRRGAGRAHRPDSRPRHSPHVQSQRFSPHHAGAAARPRGQRCLRARLRLQAGHLLRGARLSSVAKPDDMIDCQGGQITLAGRVIHDDKSDRGMGVITVATALEDPATWPPSNWRSKLAPTTSINTFATSVSAAAPASSCPAKPAACCGPSSKWSGSSIGSIAIGQEVGVTPLQLVSMVSTIANGGSLPAAARA